MFDEGHEFAHSTVEKIHHFLYTIDHVKGQELRGQNKHFAIL